MNTLLDTAKTNGGLPADEAERLRDTLADAYRNHEQVPRRRKEHSGYVSVELFEGKPPVVDRICRLIDKGFRPCDILILVRSATDGTRVAAELLDSSESIRMTAIDSM